MTVIRGCLLILLSISLLATGRAADNLVVVGTNAPATNEASAEALKLYLQHQERSNLILQEKLQALQLSLEETKAQSEVAVRRSSDNLATRLRLIEQTMTAQREREMELMQKSNRFLLTVAGVFGCVGLFAMVFTAWFLLRAMNRLAEVAAAFPPSLPASQGLTLEDRGRPIASLPAEGNRLLGAIDQLEKRIYQLEHTTHSPEANDNGDSNGDKMEIVVPGPRSSREDHFAVLLAKGESLLDAAEAEKALACFDEALALKPGHAETLVKRGTALERLKRWDDALKCYDQAITSDSTLTLAYLYKGGVYNQLEKFSEALDCYEQALRTQQKQPA